MRQLKKNQSRNSQRPQKNQFKRNQLKKNRLMSLQTNRQGQKVNKNNYQNLNQNQNKNQNQNPSQSQNLNPSPNQSQNLNLNRNNLPKKLFQILIPKLLFGGLWMETIGRYQIQFLVILYQTLSIMVILNTMLHS